MVLTSKILFAFYYYLHNSYRNAITSILIKRVLISRNMFITHNQIYLPYSWNIKRLIISGNLSHLKRTRYLDEILFKLHFRLKPVKITLSRLAKMFFKTKILLLQMRNLASPGGFLPFNCIIPAKRTKIELYSLKFLRS